MFKNSFSPLFRIRLVDHTIGVKHTNYILGSNHFALFKKFDSFFFDFLRKRKGVIVERSFSHFDSDYFKSLHNPIFNHKNFENHLFWKGMDSFLHDFYLLHGYDSTCLQYEYEHTKTNSIFLFTLFQFKHVFFLLLWGSHYYKKSVNQYFTNTIYDQYRLFSRNIFLKLWKKDHHLLHLFWFPKIEWTISTKEDYLIVLGFEHLFGKHGILKMLQKKGYQLECYHMGQQQFIAFDHHIFK